MRVGLVSGGTDHDLVGISFPALSTVPCSFLPKTLMEKVAMVMRLAQGTGLGSTCTGCATAGASCR